MGTRKKSVNIIAALLEKNIFAPFIFEGTMDTDLFNAYLEEILLPTIPLGTLITMDNASYHVSEQTRDLIEAKGCYLVYLPPYSPNLNKIENYWAILKKYIRKYLHLFSSLDDTIDYIFSNIKPFANLVGA
jgi:transposase